MALAGEVFPPQVWAGGPSRLSAALRSWQWVIKPFIRCLEARKHQGLLSKHEPSGAGSVQRGGRDAKAACKQVWASPSSPSSLNPPCEDLIHVQPCVCRAQLGREPSRTSSSIPSPSALPWFRILLRDPMDPRIKGISLPTHPNHHPVHEM